MNKQRGVFYEVAGRWYKDIAEVQRLDLIAMMPADLGLTKEGVADWMLANAAAVSKLLTTTPRSRNRKPRKDKGVPRGTRVEPEVKP